MPHTVHRGMIVPATTVQREFSTTQAVCPGRRNREETFKNRKYNGKEFIEMHGYDKVRLCGSGISGDRKFPPVDPQQPHAENYYNLSPYVYCEIPYRIDPYGMDYWSTSDPVEIERFWNLFSPALVNMLQYYSNSFNFVSWDHLQMQSSQTQTDF